MTCAHTALTCANCGADVSWKDTRIRELEGDLETAKLQLYAAHRRIRELEQFQELAAPQIITHGDDTIRIKKLEAALLNISKGARRYWREGDAAYQFAILADAALALHEIN